MALAASSAAWAQAPGGETAVVEVRRAHLRAEPEPMAAISGSLSAGDTVTVLEKRDLYWRVSADGATGWIPGNALQRQSRSLFASQGVSQEETALAARPFTPEVEQHYRQAHPDLADGYAMLDEIDRHAAFNVTEAEARQFLRAGGLMQQEGGR